MTRSGRNGCMTWMSWTVSLTAPFNWYAKRPRGRDGARSARYPGPADVPGVSIMKLPVEMCSLDAVTVKISPLAFTGALRNLVINAATHGGGALVSVTAKAETALVTIEGDGPGIPE